MQYNGELLRNRAYRTFHLVCILMATVLNVYGQDDTRKANFNLHDGVAIDGYDPVSYFTEHHAVEGKRAFSAAHQGVIYYFSSAAHRDAFKAEPARYEPAYGGWCAYAMGNSGEKVEVDPETFKVLDGKLYLFYNKFFNNTLTTWNKNESNLKASADKNWQRYAH